MKTLRSFEILDYLKDKKHCSMSELMEEFKVSPATIHRDISYLARKNLIQKVRGGVAIASKTPTTQTERQLNSKFTSRMAQNIEKKSVIAESAASYICDGDIIFLDSSTTALCLARKIQKMNLSNLTIITNSVLIIQEFHLFPPHFVLISLGGNFNCQLNSFLGKTTIENLKRLKIDKAFFSAVGITERGLTTFHENHSEFLQQALTLAEKNLLMIDSSKFGKSGIFDICPLDKIDHFVSDQNMPEYAKR